MLLSLILDLMFLHNFYLSLLLFQLDILYVVMFLHEFVAFSVLLFQQHL